MNRLFIFAYCLLMVSTNVPSTQAQPIDDVIEARIRDLKDADLARRKSAALALHSVGDRALPAIPALIEALDDADRQLRQYAASVLQTFGRRAEAAIPALWKMAQDDDAYTRQRALDAIMKIQPDSVADIQTLITDLQSTDAPRRRRSAAMLARLHQRSKPALNALIVALKDDSADVRAEAVRALAELRKDARPALNAVLVALGDGDARVRANAGLALTFIGPGEGGEDAVPPLIGALSDAIPAVRSSAAWALSRGWPGEERAVQALATALGDRGTNGTDGAQGHAGNALVDIAKRGHTKIVVTALLEFAKSHDGTPRWSAIYALGKIGPDAHAAVPSLKVWVGDKDTSVASAAATALAKIDSKAAAAVSRLIGLLQDDDAHSRERAAQGLGSVGESASAAVPALIARLEDKYVSAVRSFRLAAEQGSPEAQFALAVQLRDGLGVAEDAKAAAGWLMKAADQGHREAQRNLAVFYRLGRGVPRDDNQADEWYRRSVEQSALTRLKYTPDWEPASDQAQAYVKGEEVTVGDVRQKLLLAVAVFESGGAFTRYRYVDTDSYLGGCDIRYDRSIGIPTRSGLRYAPLEIERLKRLLAVPAEGVEFVPVAQRVFVSSHKEGRWTTHVYDAEALPRSIRQVLEFIGLPSKVNPYPPQEVASWKAPCLPTIRVAYQPDGALLVWGYDHRIDVWKRGRPTEEGDHVVHWLSGIPIAVAGPTQRVVVSRRRQLRLLNFVSGDVVAELPLSSDWNDHGNDAVFSGDGRTLVVQDWRNRHALIYDAVSGERRGKIEYEPSSAPPSVSSDGRWMAASVGDRSTCIWDLTTFSIQRKFEGFSTTSLAFAPDGESLAGEGSLSLVVWDLKTGKERFSHHSGDWSGAIRYTPDGGLLAELRRRPLIRLYDAHYGRVCGIAEGHSGDLRAITSLAFSPDGKTFATAGDDGLIKLWNIADVLDTAVGN